MHATCALCGKNFSVILGVNGQPSFFQPVAICDACGVLVCESCTQDHRRSHFHLERTIGGEVISRSSGTNKPKPKSSLQAEQLRFDFPG